MERGIGWKYFYRDVKASGGVLPLRDTTIKRRETFCISVVEIKRAFKLEKKVVITRYESGCGSRHVGNGQIWYFVTICFKSNLIKGAHKNLINPKKL